MDIAAHLADPDRPALPGPTALVVAHPDDEAIGFGGQFARAPDLLVVHLTDGAPLDGIDARRLGLPSRRAYAQARAAEREAALDLAGVPVERRFALGIPDGTAAERLADIARALDLLFRAFAVRLVFTHAYEGGHPDHDAAAAAVQAAVRSSGTAAPTVVEMPFYHAGRDGQRVVQRFADEPAGVTAPLPDKALALKREMFAVHRTQAGMLSLFDPALERFRPAPPRDVRLPANGGRLAYRAVGSALDGAGWSALARAAEAALKQP